MELIKKEVCNDIVEITILGKIKFSYKKRRRFRLIINNKGSNNIINGKNCKRHKTYGSGYINITGNNNKIYIDESSTINNAKIEIIGNNVTFNVKKNCNIGAVTSVISGAETEVLVEIGENFTSGSINIFAGGGENNNLVIGDDCLFSNNVFIYTHDGHYIYDKNTNERINAAKKSVKIGNHVWLGHGVYILKNVNLPNNTIVGAGSVVTKSFNEENTILCGNPVRIVRKQAYFKK